jgi:hypothetical protein
MSPEIARNAMVLLSRTDIKGGEAPVFMQVMQALQELIDANVSDNPPMKLVSNE